MTHLPASLAASGERWFRANWIIGPQQDVLLFIASVVTAYAVIAMHTVLRWDMLLVWFVWTFTLDTPHFFATYSRTYLDRVELRRSWPLLLGSLAIFLLAPTAIAAAYGLKQAGSPHFTVPWALFMGFLGLWAYWHITRQHYGILRLYQRKNGDIDTADARLERIVLYGCLLLSFVAFVIRHQAGRWAFTSTPAMAPLPDAKLLLGAPVEYIAALRGEQWVYLLCAIVVAALLGWFVLRQVVRFARGKPIQLPVTLFLAAVLPLYIYVGFSDALVDAHILAFIAVTTIYHDVQYLSIMWFFNRNRYGKEPERRGEFGLAGAISRNFPIYFLAAILFASLPFWGFGCLINQIPICQTGPAWGEPTFLGLSSWLLFFVCLTSGVQMHHYLLDQYIWRVGRSPELRRDLKIAERPAPVA
jgi:hypothetical protein